MAQTIVITSQLTAATGTFNAEAQHWIGVGATVLGALEEVGIEVLNGNVFVPVTDSAGADIVLSADYIAFKLEGGETYRFSKPITASACAVWVKHGPAFIP